MSSLRWLWSVTFDAFRDFVWGDLKDGVLDLRGLALPVRALVWLGFTLLLALTGALLTSETWRLMFDLVPLTQSIPGRGRLIPSAMIPASLFLVSLAWSFVLTGALRARRSIRIATIVLYCLRYVSAFDTQLLDNPRAVLVALAALLGLIILFSVAWRLRPRPAVEFLIILVLVGSAAAVIQSESVASWRLSGVGLMVAGAHLEVVGLITLIMPLLLLVGMGIAGFAAKLAGWGTAIVEDRLPHRSAYVLLALVLGWLAWQTGQATVARLQEAPQTEMLALVGALFVPLIVGVCWLVVTWLAAHSTAPGDDLTAGDIAEGVDRVALPLIVAYTMPPLALYLISISTLLLIVVMSLFGLSFMVQSALLAVLGMLSDPTVLFGWHIVVEIVVMVLALWLARHGHRAAALFLSAYALIDLKSELSYPDKILGIFTSPVAAPRVDVWWTVILVGAVVYCLLRRTLAERRANQLLFLALILLLLGQTDFISNRFSPFFGFAGIAFLAFGIIWDALTVGAWANVDTPGLPRTSRIFLYLGYVLLTIVVINWAAVSHDLAMVGQLTGDLGLVGLDRFGRPLLYAIIVATLALPGTGTLTAEELGIDEPDEGLTTDTDDTPVPTPGDTAAMT